MKQKELKLILEKHRLWLEGDEKGEVAYLEDADLRGSNLEGAYLRGSNLRGAFLIGSNLRGSNLQSADLRGAYLIGSNLRGSYLHGCNLRGSNLQGADLLGCNLRGANLRGCNLRGCNLQSADLRGAYLDNSQIETLFFKDLRYVLLHQPTKEIESLLVKIKEGKINGTQYVGDCCCLIGSLGDDKAVSLIPHYEKGIHNPSEQLFYQIREGDTPDNNKFSKYAHNFIVDFLKEREINYEN